MAITPTKSTAAFKAVDIRFLRFKEHMYPHTSILRFYAEMFKPLSTPRTHLGVAWWSLYISFKTRMEVGGQRSLTRKIR